MNWFSTNQLRTFVKTVFINIQRVRIALWKEHACDYMLCCIKHVSTGSSIYFAHRGEYGELLEKANQSIINRVSYARFMPVKMKALSCGLKSI